MTYTKYLKTIHFEKYLKKLTPKIKDKKIILYGDGHFFSFLYNHSEMQDWFEKLNIIGISDRRYTETCEGLYKFKKIKLDEIKDFSPDCILVSILEYKQPIQDLQKRFPNVLILPLTKMPFFKPKKNSFNTIYLVNNGKKEIVDKVPGFKINFNGIYNTVEIHCDKKNNNYKNCIISLKNNCNVVIKSSHQEISNMVLNLDKNCKFTLNENVFSLGFKVIMEENTNCSIGSDSFIGWGTCIRTGDAHKIIDKDGHIINNPSDINIGKHVWIGQECLILKGTNIPNNCVIGARSLLNKKYNEENALIAGSPANIKKYDITWKP